MKKLFKCSVVVVFFASSFALGGCAPSLPTKRPQVNMAGHPPYTRRQKLINKLSHLNKLSIHFGQAYTVGQTVTIDMASSFLFAPESANLLSSAEPVLKTIADLLSTYQTMQISVSVHSDNQGSATFLQGLTQAQANAIVNQLWTVYGVKTRMIYGKGFGEKGAIASNSTAVGRAANRRIVLQFRYLKG